MVTHTGDRAWQCHVCEKSFKQAGCLKRHMVIHTGEGAFQCHICEKTFTLAGSLKAHGNTYWRESIPVSDM